MLTIIYTYRGQDDRLAQVRSHKIDETNVVIVNDTGVDEHIKAVNQGIAQATDWVIIADLQRVVDRDRALELVKMDKQLGCLYLLDNGNAFLIHKDDVTKIGGYTEPFLDACAGLKQIDTKIIFDLWDSIPYIPCDQAEASNQYLDKTESLSGITVIQTVK